MTSDLGPLSTEEASKYTGLSRSTLEKARLYGGGPRFMKLGRLVKYRLEDLQDWMNARLVSSTAEYKTRGLRRP
jgi:excisionase family DNA binding protein